MSERTPGPWVVESQPNGTVWIDSVYASSAGICDLYHTDRMDRVHTKESAEANAAFIVKAVNNHDKLVEVLTRLRLHHGTGEWDLAHDASADAATLLNTLKD